MGLAILIALNIPIYLFIAWLIFGDKENAADSIYDTTMALLKIILVPPIVRVMMGMDDDEGIGGMFAFAGFGIACAAITAGEVYLLSGIGLPVI